MTRFLYAFLIAASLIGMTGCTYMGTRTVPYNELANKYINKESRYVDIDGVNIHYRDEGEGPPLLLLHGVSASLHTWDGWVDQLQDNYRIIRIDLPGFGMTGPDSEAHAYDAEYMVNKIDRFMQSLGIDKFFIAGNSLGGYFAWNYALHHPQKLYKMVLVDAVGYAQDMPFWLGFASFPVINWVTPYMMPKFMVNQSVDSAFSDNYEIPDVTYQRYFDMTQREGNRKSYIKHFKTLRERSGDLTIGDDIKDVIVPTLLMWGEEDEWVPLEVMRLFHRDLAYSEFIIYEGVGHLPMEEVPVQSARDTNNFFMSELRNNKNHPQEDMIKFYDNKDYDFHMGQNDEEL